MRGNLIWTKYIEDNKSEVSFVPDENGAFEVWKDKIIPYQQFQQQMQGERKNSFERIKEWDRQKENYLLHGKTDNIEQDNNFWTDELKSIKDKYDKQRDEANKRYDDALLKIKNAQSIQHQEKQEKEILFTTLDNVAIHGGEKYYSVCDNFELLITTCTGKHDGSWQRSFSTEEKAQEYILHNKPLFSFEEIVKLYIGDQQFDFAYKLHQEAKQKQ